MVFLYLILAVIWGVVWGIATYNVIENKGYSDNWFWWGFFFGFIALIVALTKPDANQYAVSAAPGKSGIDQKMLDNGGWKCTCGRVNPSYTGTCACKKSKQEALEREKKVQQAKEEEQELVKLKKLKEYKELLDAGVITEEEYEVKKKAILG